MEHPAQRSQSASAAFSHLADSTRFLVLVIIGQGLGILSWHFFLFLQPLDLHFSFGVASAWRFGNTSVGFFFSAVQHCRLMVNTRSPGISVKIAEAIVWNDAGAPVIRHADTCTYLVRQQLAYKYGSTSDGISESTAVSGQS